MRIAIFGAAGMLGHTLYERVAAVHDDTYAIVRKPRDTYVRYDLFQTGHVFDGVEARSIASVHNALEALRPDVVLNGIGLTTRKLGDQLDSDIIVVNSAFPHWLKEWCLANGSKMIHFSTDCVFSGKEGPYALGDPLSAGDLYGKSKALGEVAGEGVLTIRSSIIGLELEGRTELLEWLRTQRGSGINGFRNVMYSGVTTVAMADIVLELLATKAPWGGIEQLASVPISKYELAKLASDVFDLGLAVSPADEPESNKVLIPSALFRDPALQPPSWREQLEQVALDIPKHDNWQNA